MKIVFMGTPEFSVPVLENLIDAGHQVGIVVTQPDRARNRGKVTFSAVKSAAVDHGIKVLQPEKLSQDFETFDEIKSYEPDVIIVVAYGQLLKKDMLEIPKYGCFNVHGSLLPRLRGASPMQHAILDGEEITGVTVMRMAEGLDSGDMVAKAETPVDHKNFEELHDELAEMGAELLIKTLPEIESGEVKFVKQDDEKATYAGLISKNDGRINFARTPEQIERQIRAFDPWPGAFCEYKGQRVKLWKAECLFEAHSEEFGVIVKVSDEGIDVACGGRVLRIKELQMAGKKRVVVRDFLLGHKVKAGEMFA